MASILLLVLGIPLLLIGGEGLYRASRDRQPKTMTCDRFIRESPDVAWLRLGHCEIDYIGAGYRENRRGAITELFFPVRPASQPRNGPVRLVLATRDPAAIAIAEQTIGGGRQADQEQFLVMMLKIVTNLKASREINGYARRGIVERMRARRLVSGLGVPVDPSFVVIDLYARPSMRLPALIGGAGAALLAAALLLRMRGRRTRRRPTAATPVVAPVEFEAAALRRPPSRIRGLMLLNLPPTATAAMIENAPPLGLRAPVLQKLRAAMPGVMPDERGRCVFARPDCSVIVDLGPGEPIATAVVEAEGDGAPAMLSAIVEATGWRVFAPRLGTFVDPEQLERP